MIDARRLLLLMAALLLRVRRLRVLHTLLLNVRVLVVLLILHRFVGRGGHLRRQKRHRVKIHLVNVERVLHERGAVEIVADARRRHSAVHLIG